MISESVSVLLGGDVVTEQLTRWWLESRERGSTGMVWGKIPATKDMSQRPVLPPMPYLQFLPPPNNTIIL
jgi:hypothetical protein